jgi:histidinol dehydrogenase
MFLVLVIFSQLVVPQLVPEEYDELVINTSILARAEGLTAHAISAEIRKKKN